MSEKKMYLKPNVVFEPLVNQWYAWTHLISPATAPMHLVNRHLETMDSYISYPEFHEQAVANPKMRGGPFMDLQPRMVNEIQELKAVTCFRRKHQIEFAKAVAQLEKTLAAEAAGHCLEDMYEKIPACLKGYVELYYDRRNQPGYRFFEPLLYKSKYYDKSAQSIALWITNNDFRPFCLSTPRLPGDNVLHLEIPFDHPGIDKLALMKRNSGSVAEVATELAITPEQMPLFETFFTEEMPPEYKVYNGDKIRMRYFGHACILIETREVSILVDPLISNYGYSSDVEHYSDADIPEVIDYVLITHNHQDHILFETLLPLRHRIKNIIVPATYGGKLEDPDLKLMFEAVGFRNVHAIREMESISFADAIITGIPFTGEHCDLNILTKICHLVQIGEFKLMFLADSRIIDAHLYQHIYDQVGSVHVLFLGMECDGAPLNWLYGPLMVQRLSREHDESRRLSGSDCSKGMTLVDIFKPLEVYVYAMGQEPWLEFITSIKYTDESNPIIQSNRLVEICSQQGIVAERLYGEKELLYNKQLSAAQ